MQTTRILVASLLVAAVTATHAQTSPYAGEQSRDIKALSERDVKELQSGHGMGMAKAAELNGYPGPAHVLELADELQLTSQQRLATQSLLARHKAAARELSVGLIEAERALDRAFASHDIDTERLDRLTADIGSRQARLRAEHLSTHLQQTALLSPEQIARYAELRGYAVGAVPQTESHPSHH
jgi:Spy/CpxP family protein refolding chaperone